MSKDRGGRSLSPDTIRRMALRQARPALDALVSLTVDPQAPSLAKAQAAACLLSLALSKESTP